MNKKLMELKLKVDPHRSELEKELDCFGEFFSMVEFFLSRDICDEVVELWLLDYADEVEAIELCLDILEKRKGLGWIYSSRG